MNRRAFLGTSAAIVTGGTGFVAYTTMIEPHWLEIVTRDLPVAHLPAGLNGATLAQISDLHACSYVDEGYLTGTLDRVAAMTPDIVAFTGDFLTWEIDRPAERNPEQLARVMEHFPKGRLDNVGVLGNHDYGPAWTDWRIARRVASIAEATGMRVLRNETVSVAGLDFIGVDELWSGQANSRRALAQRTSAAAIALCHNPDGLDELPWGDYSGWVLSGHTHGGQCKPPFLPPPILPVKNRRYTAGEIRVDDRRSLYISRGVGHLYKVRFNVRPEVTIFTLRPAPG